MIIYETFIITIVVAMKVPWWVHVFAIYPSSWKLWTWHDVITVDVICNDRLSEAQAEVKCEGFFFKGGGKIQVNDADLFRCLKYLLKYHILIFSCQCCQYLSDINVLSFCKKSNNLMLAFWCLLVSIWYNKHHEADPLEKIYGMILYSLYYDQWNGSFCHYHAIYYLLQ